MIKEYIEKIARNHGQHKADWIEGHIKANMSPLMWWLIEHSPRPISRWLSHRSGITVNVKMTPWGDRVTIKKGQEELASKDFEKGVSDEASA